MLVGDSPWYLFWVQDSPWYGTLYYIVSIPRKKKKKKTHFPSSNAEQKLQLGFISCSLVSLIHTFSFSLLSHLCFSKLPYSFHSILVSLSKAKLFLTFLLMDHQPPSSLNSSFTYAFSYDVFLSFRGSDTRYAFTGHLYKALSDKGIRAFIDDRELQGGDQITPSLLKAIQDSRIAIPIFSANYASSSFCLDELVNIMIDRKDHLMLVLPIFYRIDPSQVRHQKGSYGEALAKHENKYKVKKDKLEKWKWAMQEAAKLSGFHFQDNRDEYENEFIGKIVKLVSSKINRTPLYVADYPVGLDSQIQQVKKLLDIQPDKGANMVGIHGAGGMGKTTLAIAIYNFIADQFDGLCFLEKVRENSEIEGLKGLQCILLEKLFGEKEIKLASVNEGISILQHRLQQKKVLLILDDVNKQKQLEALAGDPCWFGPGSKIIITTRDKQLLTCHEVENLYEVKELNEEDALELLKHKAFKSKPVDPSYEEILKRTMTYASGLPLALEVIGSDLGGKSIQKWESALDKYARIPNKDIFEILKISFEDLDEEEKNVFLDIACCLKGYSLKEVNEMLCAHYGFNMKHHTSVLIDKSLVKIKRANEVTLHDLIEEMGKKIVQQESPKEPSRLWFHVDIVQVLQHSKGSDRIEMIFLEFPFSQKEDEVKWDGEGFGKMTNLKILIIKNGVFSKGPNHLPNSLKVLEWNNYPSKDFPSHFCPNKLVICKLPNNCLSSLGLSGLLSKKEFVSVRNLNLDKCKFLREIPDVSCLEHLERLSFTCCKNLSMIHSSVGSLKKLIVLDASGCPMLRSFPPLELTSLESLDISDCERLESFPEISARMEYVRYLHLGEIWIKQFPHSFRNLTGVQSLSITSVESDGNVGSSFIQSIATMPQLTKINFDRMEGWKMPEGQENVSSSNLEFLRLTDCKLTDDFFLLLPAWFANLKELTLAEENFLTVVPECIKECLVLEKLIFSHCWELQDIRGIPPNLKHFEAFKCPKMSEWSRRMLMKKELHEAGSTEEFMVPLTPIPEWFDHHRKEDSVSFWFLNNKLPQLLLCLRLLEPSDYLAIKGSVKFHLMINGAYYSEYLYLVEHTSLFNLKGVDCNRNIVLSENDEWNFAKFECDNPDAIIEIGMHVVKQEGSIMEDIRFTDPREDIELEDEEHNRRCKQACIFFPFFLLLLLCAHWMMM